MKEKVVVGMSGGVDSSVAAYLLKKQGYDVIGVTMQIWQEEDEFVQEENGGCCGLSAVDDARRVAQMIGIPHYVMNFRKDFKDKVIDYFCEEYLNARTPNPCIACNRYVKWESLLKRCLDIGADYIATGHYSQITKLDNGRYALKCSKTQKKDQTYALYNLTQNQLSKTLMPIGAYTKDEVRQIAEEIGLLVANKPDSQDICFVVLYGNKVNCMSVPEFEDGMKLMAKIRYNSPEVPCRVYMTGEDEVRVVFDEPQRAITPGQAVVFYDGDIVAGGATIFRAANENM